MAKKKKAKIRTIRRKSSGSKRKMNDVMMEAAGLGTGAFSVNMISAGVKKIIPKASDKVIAIAPAGLGLFLMFTQKNKFLQSAGAGLFAAGFGVGLKAFGIGAAPLADDVSEVMAVLEAQQKQVDSGRMGNAPIADDFENQYLPQ